MFALLAVIAFVVGLVKLNSTDSWAFWLLLGLALFAFAYFIDAFGVGDRFFPASRRRAPRG